jgi:hypothetical protein
MLEQVDPKLVCGVGHLGCLKSELLNKIRAESGDLFTSHTTDSSGWWRGCSVHRNDGKTPSGIEGVGIHETCLADDRVGNISSCRASRAAPSSCTVPRS